MGQSAIPVCPYCKLQMKFALPQGGKGLRVYRCLDCEDTDPLEPPDVKGWLEGELRPPK